ncbi:MAG: transglutaminase-like putative cysteine protease [Bradymonadia bacterium]|jgi:transglutaminase-like putative cysteine protease
MRFIAVHKATSYLMVLTALLTVGLGATVPALVAGLVGLGAVISWWWEPPRINFKRFELFWNIATVGMLLKVIIDGIYTGAVLDQALDFVLFLSINKLFNRRTSRDYQQLYVLSFLQMTAGTVINADLSYGVLFLFYVIFTTWTLILFHLKREMEENYLLKYGGSLEGRPVRVQRVMNSRKLVGPRFLFVTSLLSIVVFMGAASLFILFPRVGFGYFFKKSRAGISMTGFSDHVELGHFGLIKNDPTVVMRVEFETPEARALLAPYWRGISFDRYDGQRWTKSVSGKFRPRRVAKNRYAIRPALRTRDARPPTLIKQSIYLEPMQTRVLFGLTRFSQVGIQRGQLMQRRSVMMDEDRDVHYAQSDDIAVNYQAFSQRESVDPALLAIPLAAYREHARRSAGRFLQLPPSLDPKVRALARTIVADAATVGDAAHRIERWLKANLTYTLDLKRDPRFTPLADFLFVQRKGHCEYFATAMAVLLRSEGIATRHVNGFLGGRWNDYGKYHAVSQGDAHSWIEIWLAPDVWITRDPTPAGAPRAADTGVMSKVRQYTDALRMRWYKYVVEYDLGAQIGMFERARGLWRSMFGGSKRRSAPRNRTWFYVLVGLALIGGAVWVLRRRVGPAHQRAARRETAIARLYTALLTTYERLGLLPKGRGTSREVLAELQARGAPGVAIAREFITRYEQVRFGGVAIDAAGLSVMRGQIKQIKAEAKAAT